MTTIYLGRTADRDRVFADVELRHTSKPTQTIEHDFAEPDSPIIAISFLVIEYRHREPWAGGQVPSRERIIVTPGDLSLADGQRLDAIWQRWHLNNMRAGCAHMPTWDEIVAESGAKFTSETQKYALDNIQCSTTTYQWGHAWLYEAPPADVVEFIESLTGARS